jgi:vacuolar protein-sorting-associated protein 4
MPIRKCQNATRFKPADNGFFTPCSPSDPAGLEMNMYDVPAGKLKEPDVCLDDYMQALTRIKPSVCIEDLDRYIDFTAKFGQDG